MRNVLQILFAALIAKPITLFLLGLNVRGRENLPTHGPAVIVANHNSHLDTLVLLSLFPLHSQPRIRPVAGADYFLSNPIVAWMAINLIGIIPLDRSGNATSENRFKLCHEALDRNEILIVFPEGTRGAPEQRGRVRKGIHYLVKDRNDTPLIPLAMHGLGRALPKGEALFVPFNCDIAIGPPLKKHETSESLIEEITTTYKSLLRECPTWHSQQNDELERETNRFGS